MANNRMYLVNTRTGARVALAKYFPSNGWYVPASVDGTLQDRLNQAFDEADFGYLSEQDRLVKSTQVKFGPPYAAGGLYGAEWVLEYEVPAEIDSQPVQSETVT